MSKAECDYYRGIYLGEELAANNLPCGPDAIKGLAACPMGHANSFPC